MNSDPMIPEEVARRALDAAIEIAQARYAKCRANVEACPNWSAAQAEWSRARDAVAFVIEDLTDNQTTIIAKAVGLG